MSRSQFSYLARFQFRWSVVLSCFVLIVAPMWADAKSEWTHITQLAETLDEQNRVITDFRGSSRKKQELLEDHISKLLLLSGWLDGFIASYPDDQNRAQARGHRLLVAVQLSELANRDYDQEQWTTELESLRQMGELTDSAHAMIESVWIRQRIRDAAVKGITRGRLHELADAALAFAKRHTRDGRAAGLAVTVGEMVQAHDEGRAEGLFKQAIKLTKKRDLSMENRAAQALAVLPFRHRPIDLEFKAADGTQIDFKELQGKVVVVDFWASWCPPCRDEAPELADLYRRYREQGMVVVGVSLDQDRKKMEAFARQSGMDWAHYFDGRGWDNKLSRKFAIASIPTVWVIDRDGLLVDHDARGKLERIVPVLLNKTSTVASAR